MFKNNPPVNIVIRGGGGVLGHNLTLVSSGAYSRELWLTFFLKRQRDSDREREREFALPVAAPHVSPTQRTLGLPTLPPSPARIGNQREQVATCFLSLCRGFQTPLNRFGDGINNRMHPYSSAPCGFGPIGVNPPVGENNLTAASID